jgi:hypothetical protein
LKGKTLELTLVVMTDMVGCWFLVVGFWCLVVGFREVLDTFMYSSFHFERQNTRTDVGGYD